MNDLTTGTVHLAVSFQGTATDRRNRMDKAVRYLTVSVFVILFSFAAKQIDTSSSSPLLPIVGSWNSECGGGNCKTEEVLEDWEDYSEECMQETCSTEELSEIAGGPAAITPMLVNYLANEKVVMQASFDHNPSPPPGAVWWYTGCPSAGAIPVPTGMVIQTSANSQTMPKPATSRNRSPAYVDYSTRTAAFTMGANLSTVTLYTQAYYKGDDYPSPVSVPCLSRTIPPMANIVKSAQLAAATPPAAP